MDTTRVLLFLFVVSSWWCCNARDLATNLVIGKSEIVTDFAGQALDYLSKNKTQTEIIDTLHKSCSKIPSFKQQCIVLVDYYATLFFLEASSIEAGEFCRKVDHCEEEQVVLSVSPDKCDICQNIVTEALLKLKDPDTEVTLISMYCKLSFNGYMFVRFRNNPAASQGMRLGWKICQEVQEISVRVCADNTRERRTKRLVFEYASIILVNAEQFLETNDLCAILHACDATEEETLSESTHAAS